MNRFSWDVFDDLTVLSLAKTLGFQGNLSEAREYLGRHAQRPHDEFIRRTKDTLAGVWLRQYPAIAEAIVRELFDLAIGPMGRFPEDSTGWASYVTRCRNTAGLRKIMRQRLVSFGELDIASAEASGLPSLIVVSPAKQSPVARRPYAFQIDAWAKLDEHFRTTVSPGSARGLVVMPTGSGKTFTAVHWLTRRWLNSGKRILWIAHRQELLSQAARTFAEMSWLANAQKQIRIRQVHTGKSRFHQIDPTDNVVCCSIHTLARAGDMTAELLNDERLFVVIDEAHHAPAKSYRDLINAMENGAKPRLLGLTATPTRTAEGERPELRRLFGGNVVYQVDPAGLIAQEILARPVPVTVKTNIDAEVGMTPKDFQHIVTFRELSPEMLARIGSNEKRNAVIVDEYKKNSVRYGKTLVFTTDVQAAAQLSAAFRETNIRSEYLTSYRVGAAGDDDTDRASILKQYAASDSGLDVLVNVEILTEGVDLPATRTVFLSRPTSSEILFRQMIGRALRGPRAGGNQEAYLVSFEDHWSTYHDFLSPVDWLAGEGILSAVDGVNPTVEQLPPLAWETVMAVAHAIRASIADSAADVFEAVPHGMYLLEYDAEGEGVSRVIHVYEHQRPSWEAAIQYLSKTGSRHIGAAAAEEIESEYFFDCDAPAPPLLDINAVVERIKAGDAAPEYIPLAGRSLCDPRALAQHAKERDLRRSEQNSLLEERYSSLARVVYPTMLDFRRSFDDALRELEHPSEVRPPKGVPIFEPLGSSPMRPGPAHDLDELMSEMLPAGSELLLTTLTHSGSLGWSKRPIKGWFGRAEYGDQPGKGDIRINVVLNSPDLSRQTLLYLLWHEYLHIYLLAGHTEEFRRLEHLWPDHSARDREMDSLNERFGVQYW